MSPCVGSSCGVQISLQCLLLLCEAWALGHVGFSSCGSQTLELGLSSCGTWAWLPYSMWNLHGPRIEPVSPYIGKRILNHWITREVTKVFLKHESPRGRIKEWDTSSSVNVIPPLNRYRNVCYCVGLLDTLVLPDSMV